VPWKESAFRQPTSTVALALKCMQLVNVMSEAARAIFALGITAAVVVATVHTIRWLIG
jgi:hypothetical protein